MVGTAKISQCLCSNKFLIIGILNNGLIDLINNKINSEGISGIRWAGYFLILGKSCKFTRRKIFI